MIPLSRALLLSDAVTPEGLARALFEHVRQGTPLERALLETGAIDERRLQEELARFDGPVIQNVVPVPELVAQLPKDLCKRLLALPIRRDARTGTVDVAVADGRNPHGPSEIGHHLRAPVRAVRAKLTTLIAAIDRLDMSGAHALAAPLWVPPSARAPVAAPSPLTWGTPIVSVDGPRRAGQGHSEAPGSAEMPIPLMRKSDPDTIREPVSSIVPHLPLPDPAPAIEAIRASKDRDAILDALLAAVRVAARRAAILVVKRDVFVGWSCTPELGSASALRAWSLSTSVPSVLSQACAEGTTKLGPIPKTPSHAGLREILRETSNDVAVAPIKVAGRVALLIVADDLADPALSTQRIDLLAEEAGRALARLVRRK